MMEDWMSEKLKSRIKRKEEDELKLLKKKLKLIPPNYEINKAGLEKWTVKELKEWRDKNKFPKLNEEWLNK